MRGVARWLVAATVAVSPAMGWAEEGHEHGGHDHGAHAHGVPASGHDAHARAPQEQTLTGEVVDVFCYLSHPADGIGKEHAGCAKKCIKNGLPVAIKVGDQLYLATKADHNPANQELAEWAAERVTVHGKVMELDGQRLIAVSSIAKAD